MKKLFCVIALTSGLAWAADQGNRSLIKPVDLSKVQVLVNRQYIENGTRELENSLFILTNYEYDLKKHGELLRKIAKAALLAHQDAQVAVMAEVQARLKLLEGVNDHKEDDKQKKNDSDSDQEEGQSK